MKKPFIITLIICFIKIVFSYNKTTYIYNRKEASLHDSSNINISINYNKSESYCQTINDCGKYAKKCFIFNENVQADYDIEIKKTESKRKEVNLKEEGRCYYQFFCHENEGDCISINENEIKASYMCSLGDKTLTEQYELIIETCNNKASSNCITHQCSSNDQCFSKKCINNQCITNEKDSIIECVVYHSTRKSEMRCKKALNEYCNNHNDCLTDVCKNGICQGPRDSYFFLFLAGACQLFLYSSFFIFCCYSKGIYKLFHIGRRIK